ncbi:uncharacterized protein J8A68_003240 [[Candida] subhashii]|uniref:Uncharacterized protein n=1 Tax=[Candida] subhashii TaxID=561895 RepID=A0A8J5QMP3_9ASCO|nr:uncharacterized protein J8A68_003240 [[Candida] subhashii]KAG7663240.1 hypothetical protein J8A68_003240 [[Candida] subhashii]
MSDLELKPNQPTFVAENPPQGLGEIELDGLLAQITQGDKDINKLHIYHAIFILSKTLHSIIQLQQNPDLCHTFRTQLLKKMGFNEDDLIKISENKYKISTTPIRRPDSPSLSPPLKFAKLNNRPNFEDEGFTNTYDTVADYLLREGGNPDSMSKDELEVQIPDLPQDYESVYEDNIDDIKYHDTDSNDNKIDAPFIPLEQLLPDLNLDVLKNPITDINLDNLKSEILRSTKRSQNTHLLKIFNLIKIPPLSIDDFLLRIKQYSPSISVSSYIHSAFIMFKMTILLDLIPLTMNNVYRFIVASIRCSSKNIEDMYQRQKVFATVVGVSLKDLFRLEVGFLYLCDFKVIIGELMLNKFLKDEFSDLCLFMKENFQEGL